MSYIPGSLETFTVKFMASLTPVPVQLLQNSEKQQHGSQQSWAVHMHAHTHVAHTLIADLNPPGTYSYPCYLLVASSCNPFPGRQLI